MDIKSTCLLTQTYNNRIIGNTAGTFHLERIAYKHSILGDGIWLCQGNLYHVVLRGHADRLNVRRVHFPLTDFRVSFLDSQMLYSVTFDELTTGTEMAVIVLPTK